MPSIMLITAAILSPFLVIYGICYGCIGAMYVLAAVRRINAEQAKLAMWVAAEIVLVRGPVARWAKSRLIDDFLLCLQRIDRINAALRDLPQRQLSIYRAIGLRDQ